MANVEKRTFSLSSNQTQLIDKLVRSGDYATGSEVIRAGLRALQERDEAFRAMLKEEVVPVAIRMRNNPDQAIPMDDVFNRIRGLKTGHQKKTT